ncbi:hypothetical protein JCM15519_06290 [Fundidesulfovibrio butyratiphilus]
MKGLEGTEENLRFMVLEVSKQVENAQKVVEKPDPDLILKIESRDDYIDNLKSVIENACFSRIHATQDSDKRTMNFARAVNIISNNLERVADHAVNIVMQMQYLRDPGFVKRYDYAAFFNEALKSLDLIVKALYGQDLTLAFRICRCEVTLDNLFKQAFEKMLTDLRKGESPENCITTHNIFRYLERMGDAILNIGEAIIFSVVGEKFKIHQYEALKGSLAKLGHEVPISDVEFHSIWGTRSGCRISRVEPDASAGGLLFKEGNAAKLCQEMENIGRWEEISPGLAPKVQFFKTDGDSASMLMEFLGGSTFQDVVLSDPAEVVGDVSRALMRNVDEIWTATAKRQPARGKFIPQLKSRLNDVFRMHPSFNMVRQDVAGVLLPSLAERMERLSALEKDLEAPFSVFIHGDFNINNIIYNYESKRIHYIDLHRSKQYDYVQDVSVFLVSIFRLPVQDPDSRERFDRVTADFLNFFRQFAAKNDDDTFEARNCLGLIRSFVTSSRFEFNRAFAKDMFLRGVYLMDKFLAHGEAGPGWDTFTLPEDVLRY